MAQYRHFKTSGTSRKARVAGFGFTLLELALAMMILGILSVGVSSLLKSGVENQISRRSDATMQAIAMTISEDLRFDTHTAEQVSISADGLTMQLLDEAGTPQVTYRLNAGLFTRVNNSTNTTKTYNDPAVYNTPIFTVNCQDPTGVIRCFTMLPNSNSALRDREVQINQINVVQAPANSQRTLMDNHFAFANFSLRSFTFNITGSTQFQ